MKDYKTLQDCIEQLEMCKYECIGGNLENNVAFIKIKELAQVNNLNLPFVSQQSEQLCFNCNKEPMANSFTGLCKKCYVEWNRGKPIKTNCG